jgi:hypothetical protein
MWQKSSYFDRLLAYGKILPLGIQKEYPTEDPGYGAVVIRTVNPVRIGIKTIGLIPMDWIFDKAPSKIERAV